MAEEKSSSEDKESSEFATQKIDPEKLMAAQGESGTEEQATRKIDDSMLEAAVAQEAMDSGATMKVTQDELQQAMEEELRKAPKVSQAAEPAAEVLESPKIEKLAGGSSTARSKIDPTVAAIIAVALVLVACMCSCALVIAVLVTMGGNL